MLYNEIMLNDIKDHLLAFKETLAVAESVTSGHLQAAFSAAKEAMNFFQGGITTYNLGQKCRHLSIEPIHAEKCDCISEEVARQMALKSTELFLSNFGIGITGYATKVPEKEADVLFSYFAIAYNKEIIHSGKIISKKESSVEVQVDYSNQVIEILFQLLHKRSLEMVVSDD